jgi:hypothetical protein
MLAQHPYRSSAAHKVMVMRGIDARSGQRVTITLA